MRTACVSAMVAALLGCVAVASGAIWQYEIQNKSGTDADDAHLVFKHKVSDAKNGAFTDPPSGIGSNTLDWPAPGGSGTVPAGYKWWFKTKEPEKTQGSTTSASAGLIPESSYFTTGGTKIPNSVKWTDCDGNQTWEEDPSTGIWKTTVSIHNPSTTQGVYVSNVKVWRAIDMALYTMDNFTNLSAGVLEPGIPSDFWILAGETVAYELPGVDCATFVRWTGSFALENEIAEPLEFWMGSALPWPGDANFDRVVDGADLATWQQNYDPLGENENTFNDGDWTGDGKIDGADLALWQQNYNPLGLVTGPIATPPPAEIPEPGTLALLSLAVVGLIVRRR